MDAGREYSELHFSKILFTSCLQESYYTRPLETLVSRGVGGAVFSGDCGRGGECSGG